MHKNRDPLTGNTATDKASPEYWGGVWTRPVPQAVDLDEPRLDNHMNQLLGTLLDRHLLPARPERTLLEAGCGGSAWLPVFAKRYECQILGLDYSASGCALARETLRAAGVAGEILEADLFAPPERLLEVADIVFSQGLVEHFTPTGAIVARLADLTRPGGLVLTLVPNMHGLTGLVQRLMDARIFALHTPLSPAALALAHQDCGLVPLECGHLGTLNLSVANHARWAGRPLLDALLARAKAWPSKLVWLAERALGRELPNGITSPLVYCVARKPAPQEAAA